VRFASLTRLWQPFHFGDPFRKTTCLWLKNLPPLQPTNNLGTGAQACWREPPAPDRWKTRSRTYGGIAQAMAQQWGALDRHRFEVPRAAYSSKVVDGYLVRCRVGPHSADRSWPWWAPWAALEGAGRVLDGAHPSVTWDPIARPGATWAAPEQLWLPWE
jgi:hypothetical protein